MLAVSLPCLAQEARDAGYTRSYTIHADGAWLAPGKVISPAFVTLRDGVISQVSAAPPKEQKGMFGFGGSKPKVLRVKGILAPGVVDAWSALAGSGVNGDRHAVPQRRMIDELVLHSADYLDQSQMARVVETRNQGVAATYLSFPKGGMQRGIGIAASFNAADLLHPEESTFLEIALVGPPIEVEMALAEFRALFENAQEWRESWDTYDEKLEKHEKDLEKYEKDFDEYLKKKKEAAAAEEKGQAAEDEKDEKDEKDELKMPKRPKEPSAPRPETARDDILAVMDGKMGVRLEAFTVSAIRTALELQQEMGFSMVLVGATQAHRLAEELAAADVPVILSAGRMGNPDFPSETLLSRWSTLKEAGVKVALASGRSGADLLLAGGQLISAGANQTDVWHALTTIPAQILGIDQKFGSIGNGQSGSMILFEGSSPFDLSAPFRAHKPR